MDIAVAHNSNDHVQDGCCFISKEIQYENLGYEIQHDEGLTKDLK